RSGHSLVLDVYCCCCFFFFQAEDGIRDRNVTGVQTCALPISVGVNSPATARYATANGHPLARPATRVRKGVSTTSPASAIIVRIMTGPKRPWAQVTVPSLTDPLSRCAQIDRHRLSKHQTIDSDVQEQKPMEAPAGTVAVGLLRRAIHPHEAP